MDAGDVSTDPFLDSGDFTYVEKLQKMYTSQNKLIDEILDLQGPGNDTISAAIDALITDMLKNRIICQDGIQAVFSTELNKLIITLV